MSDHLQKSARYVAFLAVAVSVFATPNMAIEKADALADCVVVYENHNQVDYGPLRVALVVGKTDSEVEGQKADVVPGACLGLFAESTHQLVAAVRADEKGHFELKHVKAGRYRLVARAEGLCTANIPLVVRSSGKHKAIIIVHFRPRGIDSCSYGELVNGA